MIVYESYYITKIIKLKLSKSDVGQFEKDKIMQGTQITIHKVNSGYQQDYGYHTWVVDSVVSLDIVPTIKVFDPLDASKNTYLAWFRGGEWVVDFD